MMRPTEDTYEELQTAFDYFNNDLFDGVLPHCLITLQREKKSYGYFSPKRFVNKEGQTTDEIALNPAYFAICPPEEILQTLVHEMTHLWQNHNGKPGRRGYHNKQWARKMESIGLMPSSTGRPGGSRTGDKMADYIIDGGNFLKSCQHLLTQNYRITWADKFPAREYIQAIITNGNTQDLEQWGIDITQLEIEHKQTRVKYTCPVCKVNAWGKSTLNLICGNCEVRLEHYR